MEGGRGGRGDFKQILSMPFAKDGNKLAREWHTVLYWRQAGGVHMNGSKRGCSFTLAGFNSHLQHMHDGLLFSHPFLGLHCFIGTWTCLLEHPVRGGGGEVFTMWERYEFPTQSKFTPQPTGGGGNGGSTRAPALETGRRRKT